MGTLEAEVSLQDHDPFQSRDWGDDKYITAWRAYRQCAPASVPARRA